MKFNFRTYFSLIVLVWFATYVSAADAAGGEFSKQKSGQLTIQPTKNNAPFGDPSFVGEYEAGTTVPFSLPDGATDVSFTLRSLVTGNVIQKQTVWMEAPKPGGGIQLLDLDTLRAMIGLVSVLTPQIASENTPLFTLVNLGEWITGGVPPNPSFAEGDAFNIVNGEVFNSTGALLPGLLVGTSDILFSSSTGGFTADPYTGLAIVDGTVSIAAAPEPGTLLLLLVGYLALLRILGMWRSSAHRPGAQQACRSAAPQA